MGKCYFFDEYNNMLIYSWVLFAFNIHFFIAFIHVLLLLFHSYLLIVDFTDQSCCIDITSQSFAQKIYYRQKSIKITFKKVSYRSLLVKWDISCVCSSFGLCVIFLFAFFCS